MSCFTDGYDNSGRKGPIHWPNNQNNADRAKAVITTIAKRFQAAQYYGTVTSIELLNEPAGYTGSQLLQFTKE